MLMSSALRRRLAIVVAFALLVTTVAPATGFAAKDKDAGKVGAQSVDAQTAVFYEDEFEPDDTRATAYVYNPAVDGNTWTSYRTIHGANGEIEDEVDYVAVTVTETDTPIWVETQYIDGFADSWVEIEDSEGTVLVYQDDSDWWPDGSGSASSYFLAPEPGTYYVAVYPYADSNPPFAYWLHITVGDARRVAGHNRFETAAEVSRLMWDYADNPWWGTGYSPDYIVVANGRNPADALAGGALAAQLGGIVLLTNRDYLPWETWMEIERVTQSGFWDSMDITVLVLGGPAAVSDDVVGELESIRSITHVERLAGANRYATAAEIATATVDLATVGTTAFVVNGEAWPDALAVAPVAAYNESVVLMTRKSSVPAVTMDWMDDNGITDVVVVGGEAVVDATAYAELDASFDVTRVAGVNRYETAKKVALWGVDNAGMEPSLATLVSGENFPDALSAAPISWWTGAPVLLTRQASLHPQVVDYFDENGAIGYPDTGDYNEGMGCYVLGGPAAVSEATYMAFRDLWMEYLP